jgi:ABC-type transporter Mla subunit MlaD
MKYEDHPFLLECVAVAIVCLTIIALSILCVILDGRNKSLSREIEGYSQLTGEYGELRDRYTRDATVATERIVAAQRGVADIGEATDRLSDSVDRLVDSTVQRINNLRDATEALRVIAKSVENLEDDRNRLRELVSRVTDDVTTKIEGE